jgi:HK97 family phage portal protein
MAILSGVRSFFGGVLGLTRLPGLQTPNPRTYPASSAANVNFDTALGVSAWWAGCRLLSETVAGLPVRMYRLQDNAKIPEEDHPLWYTLNVKPNQYQNKVEFWETVMLNLVASGNSYVAIERRGNQVISLLPLMSSQMTTELMDDGSIVHTYYSGTSTRVYSSESMWHIKLFGNGVIGLSPLTHARQSLGITIAAENRLGSVYRNGGKPTGILMVDKLLTKDQRTQIRANMAELAEGNNDNLFVLEAGMKYEAVSMTPQDIELLESRRFQLEDVARFLGVPSVLINDTSGSTTWGSGVQQIIDGFYKLNLRPYLERLEAGIRSKLLTESDARRYSVEFDFDALLRMDQSTRFDGYNKGINGGVLTPNEARALEGWMPMPGGDTLLVNSSMIPLNSVGTRQGTTNGN